MEKTKDSVVVTCKTCGEKMDVTNKKLRTMILENKGIVPCEKCGSLKTSWSRRRRKALATIAGLALCVASVFVCGCKTDGDSGSGTNTPTSTVGSNRTYVVTVGMENSKFAGSCPGAGVDAQRMSGILANYTKNIKSFASATATKANVVAAMKDAVSKADLFIFYYSGHGGSDPFWDTGAEEDDGRDEYFCLYDTYLRDNEVWEIISKAKGRIWLIADCCHSRTIYRQPGKITFSKMNRILRETHVDNGPIVMECWSGCPDDTYSYGSAAGGEFTNTLRKYYKAGKTYDALWTEIESDKNLQLSEKVQRTKMGGGFGDKPVFE